MLDYTSDLLVRPIMADRNREAVAITRAAAATDARLGLRARFASRLARLARALHPEAATETVLSARDVGSAIVARKT